jgi:hypothetical protein
MYDHHGANLPFLSAPAQNLISSRNYFSSGDIHNRFIFGEFTVIVEGNLFLFIHDPLALTEVVRITLFLDAQRLAKNELLRPSASYGPTPFVVKVQTRANRVDSPMANYVPNV